MSNATRTEIEVAPIKVVAINVPKFQKGTTLNAELHQLVTTHAFYPSMKVKNSLSDNIFDSEEFGAETEEQEFISYSDRTAFMVVPAGTTVEELQTRFDTLSNKGWIYRILSNQPILSAEHLSAIANGRTTKDLIAESQVLRYPKTESDKVTPHPKALELILDDLERPQYKVTYFTRSEKDKDLRTSDPNDMYLTPLLEAELNLGTSIDADMVETNMQSA